MGFDKDVFEDSLELGQVETVAQAAEQDAEMNTYDFDFWVVRDRPPYMV